MPPTVVATSSGAKLRTMLSDTLLPTLVTIMSIASAPTGLLNHIDPCFVGMKLLASLKLVSRIDSPRAKNPV